MEKLRLAERGDIPALRELWTLVFGDTDAFLDAFFELLYPDCRTAVLEEDGRILPPLNSLPGVGTSAALAFVQARSAGPFISQDDMVRRKVAKSVVETLRQAGCLNDLPETSQVTLFEFGG